MVKRYLKRYIIHAVTIAAVIHACMDHLLFRRNNFSNYYSQFLQMTKIKLTSLQQSSVLSTMPEWGNPTGRVSVRGGRPDIHLGQAERAHYWISQKHPLDWQWFPSLSQCQDECRYCLQLHRYPWWNKGWIRSYLSFSSISNNKKVKNYAWFTYVQVAAVGHMEVWMICKDTPGYSRLDNTSSAQAGRMVTDSSCFALESHRWNEAERWTQVWRRQGSPFVGNSPEKK